MSANPLRKPGPAETTIGKPDNHLDDIRFERLDFDSIQNEKDVRSGERDALVAIDEGVIAGDSIAVFRGEGWEVSVVQAFPKVARPGQSSIPQACITNTWPTPCSRI